MRLIYDENAGVMPLRTKIIGCYTAGRPCRTNNVPEAKRICRSLGITVDTKKPSTSINLTPFVLVAVAGCAGLFMAVLAPVLIIVVATFGPVYLYALLQDKK